MNSATAYRLGIDLGGTKIEGILLNQDGEILDRQRVPTPPHSYTAIIDAIDTLARQLHTESTLPVGIGTPGSVSGITGLMRNSNTTCLNGMPLQKDLQQQLKRPVRIANDADCFTLSEASDGAASGAHTVFGVILGTGVGGGICIDGRLLQGVNGIAGEWGHNYLRLPDQLARDRACFCGKRDCNETWLSGPGLARSYLEVTGNSLTAEEIAKLAQSGDGSAVGVMDDYYDLLASAVSMVINVIDPDVVVFGGGLSNIPDLCDQLSLRLPVHVFSNHVNTRLTRAVHGDSSGVRGAAWLWP